MLPILCGYEREKSPLGDVPRAEASRFLARGQLNMEPVEAAALAAEPKQIG